MQSLGVQNKCKAIVEDELLYTASIGEFDKKHLDKSIRLTEPDPTDNPKIHASSAFALTSVVD